MSSFRSLKLVSIALALMFAAGLSLAEPAKGDAGKGAAKAEEQLGEKERKAREKLEKQLAKEKANQEEQAQKARERLEKKLAREKAREEERRLRQEEEARKAKERLENKLAEEKAKEEEAKQKEEEAARKVQEEEQKRLEREKAKKEEAERQVREEIEKQKAREKAKEEERKGREEGAARKAKEEQEEAARKVKEAEERRLAREEAKKRAEEERARKEREEAQRKLEMAKAKAEAEGRKIEDLRRQAKEAYETELARIEEIARQEELEKRIKANEPRMALAAELDEAGKPEAALEIMTAIEKEQALPSGFKSLNNRISAAVRTRVEALKQAQDQAQKSPDDAQCKFALGYVYYEQGKFKEGVEQYAAIVKTAPGDAFAQSNLGYGLQQLGDDAKAEQAYRAALAARPNLLDAQTALACLLAAQKKALPEAVQLAEKAYAASPGDAEAMHALGFANLQSGSLDKALDLLAAAARKSDSEEIQYHYGAALAQAGQGPKACSVLAKVVRMHGKSAELAKALMAQLAKTD